VRPLGLRTPPYAPSALASSRPSGPPPAGLACAGSWWRLFCTWRHPPVGPRFSDPSFLASPPPPNCLFSPRVRLLCSCPPARPRAAGRLLRVPPRSLAAPTRGSRPRARPPGRAGPAPPCPRRCPPSPLRPCLAPIRACRYPLPRPARSVAPAYCFPLPLVARRAPARAVTLPPGPMPAPAPAGPRSAAGPLRSDVMVRLLRVGGPPRRPLPSCSARLAASSAGSVWPRPRAPRLASVCALAFPTPAPGLTVPQPFAAVSGRVMCACFLPCPLPLNTWACVPLCGRLFRGLGPTARAAVCHKQKRTPTRNSTNGPSTTARCLFAGPWSAYLCRLLWCVLACPASLSYALSPLQFPAALRSRVPPLAPRPLAGWRMPGAPSFTRPAGSSRAMLLAPRATPPAASEARFPVRPSR